jgi:hypothetical protein
MTPFVAQLDSNLAGLAVSEGPGERALSAAGDAPFAVAQRKDAVTTWPTQYFVLHEAGDSFRSAAPQENFSVPVQNKDASVQGFKNAAIDLGFNCWHEIPGWSTYEHRREI